MVLHGFTWVLRCYQSQLSQTSPIKSNNFYWVELREDPRETIVRRSFWKLSQLILRLVHILHVSCANIKTHNMKEIGWKWLWYLPIWKEIGWKWLAICYDLLSNWIVDHESMNHCGLPSQSNSDRGEPPADWKTAKKCTYYHDLCSGYPSSNVAGKSPIHIIKYH